MSRTLLIIKPDATERNLIGHIVSRVERARFTIAEMRMVRLSQAEARRFYAVHEGEPFLDKLVEFMSSGTVVAMVLEKENAVQDLRVLVGTTDPTKAPCGTLRWEIGRNIRENSVHASDSDASAEREIAFFFS